MELRRSLLASGALLLAAVCIAALLTSNRGPAEAAPSALIDVYPLYQVGSTWSEPFPLSVPPHVATNSTNKTLVGYVVTSEPSATTTNINMLTEPFREYYNSTLLKNGWSIDLTFHADGPGNSVWAYRKDDALLIFSYNTDFLEKKPNEPVQCPCKVSFSILGGKQE